MEKVCSLTRSMWSEMKSIPTKGDIMKWKVPAPCVAKRNQMELILEVKEKQKQKTHFLSFLFSSHFSCWWQPMGGHCTSLQAENSGRFLLARRNHRVFDECRVFDLESSFPLESAPQSELFPKLFPFQEDSIEIDNDVPLYLSSPPSPSEPQLQPTTMATTETDGMSESEVYSENEEEPAEVFDVDLIPMVEVSDSFENLFPYRMVFQIPDSGNAEGFIKGPSWAHDGSIFASPFSNE
jgi:hypothetical protein